MNCLGTKWLYLNCCIQKALYGQGLSINYVVKEGSYVLRTMVGQIRLTSKQCSAVRVTCKHSGQGSLSCNHLLHPQSLHFTKTKKYLATSFLTRTTQITSLGGSGGGEGKNWEVSKYVSFLPNQIPIGEVVNFCRTTY